MRTLIVLAILMLATPQLAGCIGGEEAATNDTNQPPELPSDNKVLPPGQQPDLGWIYGIVMDKVTNLTLGGVNVSMAQFGATESVANGTYYLLNIPRGDYVLSAKLDGYILARYSVTVFADQGTRQDFQLQPLDKTTPGEAEAIVTTTYYFKETSGATYLMDSPGAMDNLAAPEGEAAKNEVGGNWGGYGVTSLPNGVAGGRPAARMVWEAEMKEPLTMHADTENPVEFPDPSMPGSGVSLIRYSALKFTLYKWKGESVFIPTVRVEDVAPDGSVELLALRIQEGGSYGGPPEAGLVELDLPFMKKGKEFHTVPAGHKLRVVIEESGEDSAFVIYWFDGANHASGLTVRKGPFLEPPKAGDRVVLTFSGDTVLGANPFPYGIAWRPNTVPPEVSMVPGARRTGAGGLYFGTLYNSTGVGDATVYFDVPKGAQTVYSRLDWTEPPVRDPTALFSDFDILIYEPSGSFHTHTAGYGANQPELQYHDVFETPEWPQRWSVEIFAFAVYEAKWTLTVEIVF